MKCFNLGTGNTAMRTCHYTHNQYSTRMKNIGRLENSRESAIFVPKDALDDLLLA